MTGRPVWSLSHSRTFDQGLSRISKAMVFSAGLPTTLTDTFESEGAAGGSAWRVPRLPNRETTAPRTIAKVARCLKRRRSVRITIPPAELRETVQGFRQLAVQCSRKLSSGKGMNKDRFPL